MARFVAPLAALLLAGGSMAQAPAPDGDIRPVHDPVLIRQGGTWHVFSTGIGKDGQGLIAARTSPDLVHWRAGTPPFATLPDWAVLAIPGRRTCGRPTYPS